MSRADSCYTLDGTKNAKVSNRNKLCAWRHDMPRRSLLPVGAVAPRAAEPTAAPADGNVAAVSHAQYVPARWPLQLPVRKRRDEQTGLVTLTFDLLILKVVSESRVTWATSVPILVFLGLSVLHLGPIYVSEVRQKHRLMPRRLLGAGA